MVDPKVGDVLHIGAQASVQFAGTRSLILRVTAVRKKPTYEGWCWLTGYVLDLHGDAVERREVFVQRAGLRRMVLHDQRPGIGGQRPASGMAPAGVRMEENRGVRYPGQAR
ncbi:hypothetical protein [Micromonospora sp. NBC_01813]|uniref:hypothetical protein n=1 Tax=Micromonospora sp. NBC_01813 TaxID=2975988 RepID=UPI002DDBDE10|nr:hypothetical protein [Micromonospora sp. NBC_01813]WSA09007.1 hypothetical protein OG958_33445 [Micromonospora sp. NBC_01813]